MKTLLLIALVLVASACAHVEQPETIAYNAPLELSTMLSGGVPIVDGSIYAGVQSMPEVVVKNASTAQMSTTKFAPFTALAGSQQTDKYLQMVTVVNRDTTGSICLYLETWSQTCASSVAFTCEGATLQGMTTPAGTSREFRISGGQQICANASEAAVDGELERTVVYAR